MMIYTILILLHVIVLRDAAGTFFEDFSPIITSGRTRPRDESPPATDEMVPKFSPMKPRAVKRLRFDDEMVQNLPDQDTAVERFHTAAEKNMIEDAKALLQSGVKIDVTKPKKDKWTALHCAARGGHKEMVTFLVGEGATVDIPDVVDSENPTALRVLIEYGDIEIARVLLGAGANIGLILAEDMTGILQDFVYNRHLRDYVDLASFLFEHNVRVNLPDLMEVSRKLIFGHIDTAQELFELDIKDQLEQSEWRTLLWIVMYEGATGSTAPIVFEKLSKETMSSLLAEEQDQFDWRLLLLTAIYADATGLDSGSFAPEILKKLSNETIISILTIESQANRPSVVSQWLTTHYLHRVFRPNVYRAPAA